MNGRSILTALALTCTAAAGCGGGDGGGGEIPQDVIVVVDGTALTESHLELLLPAGDRIPFSPSEKEARVEQWVEMELLYREAVRKGLHNDPRISARLESLEREFLADHLIFLELRERIEVSEEEIEEHFEKHEREYANEYRVSHIMVNTREEAEHMLELLEKRSFTWVANRYSVDPVARRGGDLGYLTKGNMIPAFETVIFDMKPGEVSRIVQSDFGFHIIKLVGTRRAQVKVELADVRERIMNDLVVQRREAAYSEFIEMLRGKAEIEYVGGGMSGEGTAADTLPPVAPGADTTAAGGV